MIKKTKSYPLEYYGLLNKFESYIENTEHVIIDFKDSSIEKIEVLENTVYLYITCDEGLTFDLITKKRGSFKL